MSLKDNVQNWIKLSFDDPIAKILSKNSNLTKTQLETLLIDILAENLTSKELKYDEKAKLRQTKAQISRGSFNRTLKQAKRNTIQSIYTIILLGYFGIFEDTTLTPYLNIATKLKVYREAYTDLSGNGQTSRDQANIMNALREELEDMINQLSRPWTSRT